MPDIDFDSAFQALTGNAPFPWQRALYERFLADRPDNIPPSCNLPTGLGKTSVIAVWLVALANRPARVPRRLAYVVNRRTVVDQTTTEVEKYRDALVSGSPLANALWELCALRPEKLDPKKDRPLAISTLRGQFADNREWSADPARPAVICGTVDMIGSRLLFSGYGCGFKTRPLHAGLLGQDALLVHDEAHLEPAFQDLLLAIEDEQRSGRTPDFRPLRVMELTATSRAGGEPFRLTPADYDHDTVRKRMHSKKGIAFHEVADDKKAAAKVIELARGHKDSGQAVLVFLSSVEAATTAAEELAKEFKKEPKSRVQSLTGTLRGYERDNLVKDEVFIRFLPPANRPPGGNPRDGTVYLVCTSAGEVGVNISADHVVSDLTPYESMAQRLGRVNRFGGGDARVDVVHPSKLDTEGKPRELARERTLALLRALPKRADGRHEGNPHELGRLRERSDVPCAVDDAFAPPPTVLPVSDILFDAWALTTVRDRLPGRPHVEPYLHGISGWEPPTTHVAWREEVWEFRTTDADGTPRAPEAAERRDLAKRAEDLLEDYPLKAHELLGDRTDRVFKHLAAIAERQPHLVAWLVDDEGTVQVFTLGELADKDEKDRLNNQTVLLAPQAGGLRDGLLAGDAAEPTKFDVADEWFADEAKQIHRRRRLWDGDPKLAPMLEVMRLIRKVEFSSSEDEDVVSRTWYWLEQMTGDTEGSKNSKLPVLWEVHTDDVVRNTQAIVTKLLPGDPLGEALVVAAKCHDLGKKRRVFQTVLGNAKYPDLVLAKSGQKTGRVEERYRHEFGSLADAPSHPAWNAERADVVLHAIATHHGRGRPHFPADEAFDPDSAAGDDREVAAAVPQRFARLQRTYGRWGLAYLESLLRAADYAASANPSAFHTDATATAPAPTRSSDTTARAPRVKAAPTPPTPAIRVKVDPTNPGQFFACCGLLELADRLWPGAEGWFADGEFQIACAGTLDTLLAVLVMDPPVAVERLESNGLPVAPIVAPLSFSFDGGATTALTLDAWTRITTLKGVVQVIGNPPWNFWSGRQNSLGIWSALRAELAALLRRLAPADYPAFLTHRLFQNGRFGFDPGPAWNALDVGFSPNEQSMEVESSPAVELLAAVGLQRFRPVMNESRDAFDYFTWHAPAAPDVAAAAMAGALPDGRAARFRCPVVSRGQYAALGFAYPIR